MKLKACIEVHKDDPVIKIGMNSGFVFVGDYDEYNRMIQKISDGLLQSAKNNIIEKRTEIGRAQTDIGLKQYKDDVFDIAKEWLELKYDTDEALDEIKSTAKSMEKKAKSFINRLAGCAASIIKTQDYVDHYIHIPEREVKDEYSSPTGTAYIIIVEGGENGDFWLQEEYDRIYKKRG